VSSLIKKKIKVGKSKYRRFTNEDSSEYDDDDDDDDDDKEGRRIDSNFPPAGYGALTHTPTEEARDFDGGGGSMQKTPSGTLVADDTVNFYHAHESRDFVKHG
jgi:hypothetical protein